MTRPRRVLLTALAGLVATALAGPALDARDTPDPDEVAAWALLERAQAGGGRYAGVVRVAWRDGGGDVQADRVRVRRNGRVLTVDGTRDVLAYGSQRLVESADGWVSIGAGPATSNLPDPTDEWELRRSNRQPVVAGVSATLLEVIDRDTGSVRQRIYVDTDRPLVLKREILDAGGETYREVEFVRVATTRSRLEPLPAEPDEQEAPTAVPVDDAPEEVGDGFRLVGAYDLGDGVVQLFYSDGLFGVSVFREDGELGTLPDGATTREVDGEDLQAYATAVGDVLVWEGDDRVLAWVSDAPPDHLDGVAASFTPGGDPSGWSRAADVLLGPFAWR